MMLRFKIDENLPAEVATLLTDSGHDASTVLEQRLSGYPDSQISQVCQQEQRIIVTLDLDFSDIRLYPPQEYSGIVVFRLVQSSKRQVLEATRRLLPLLDKEMLTGRLWIVDETRVRIRS